MNNTNPFASVFVSHARRVAKAPKFRESVYTAIKEAILSGQLPPNQPLVEEQLAASLNISRTPVREALAVLQHEQLIGPRGGRGLYVLTVTRAEFVEMFTANEVIEPYLARRAALYASSEQLEGIATVLTHARESIARQNMAGFLRASRDFHHLVGEAAGNSSLTAFVVANEERTDMYLLHSGKVIDSATMTASLREHEAIYEALLQRDSEAAERLVIYHAQSLRARLADLFAPQNEIESADRPHPAADGAV